MDCDPTTACSGKRISFNHRKKVSWAFNLEQVMYFFPNVEIQQFRKPEGRKATASSMQTNLEKKPQALKNKRFVSFAEVANRDILHWLQEKCDKISEQYCIVNFKDLTLSEET